MLGTQDIVKGKGLVKRGVADNKHRAENRGVAGGSWGGRRDERERNRPLTEGGGLC
jgi:hypothetical protein